MVYCGTEKPTTVLMPAALRGLTSLKVAAQCQSLNGGRFSCEVLPTTHDDCIISQGREQEQKLRGIHEYGQKANNEHSSKDY